MNPSRIQQRFTDFYRALDFHLLPRSPLLHPSIPMSFVMSAGLVEIETSLAQLKNRPTNKFVLIQQCFRHFDLDKVGTDAFHLSLFEMPGAFVFGNIGKSEIVQRMWALATSALGVDKSLIWVSYFKGGKVLEDYLPSDDETHKAWVDVGVPENQIIGLGPKDNYWVQGGGIDGMEPTRKCGPNTELFYDRGAERACGSNCCPGCRCGRFIEFANSLFICRELGPNGSFLRLLADPFTETVIGTERVAMILQGAESVFDIDGYRPIIDIIHSFVHTSDLPESSLLSGERVIADYLKALYCLVADGAPPPGKDGRGRIIKLLIRGVMTRQIVLSIESTRFLQTLMDLIPQTACNGLHATPENKTRLESYFATESQRFSKTIERGHRQLMQFLKTNNGGTLSGTQIVWLEKNRGLPALLTAMMLREKGLAFAETEYTQALETWKQRPLN